MQIPWKGHFKSGKSSVLQARNESFVRRGFRRKVLFSFQAQSCPRLFRTLPFTLLRQTAAYKYILPIFSEILSAVFMCVQLPGNRVFNQSHCLFKVCVPAKEEFFFAGFLPSASQTHRGCGQSFAILGAFLALVVRSMTYVWKCKRTCSSVAWRMCGSARERTVWLQSQWTLTSRPTPPPPPPTPTPKISTRAWPLTGVDTSYWCWHQKHGMMTMQKACAHQELGCKNIKKHEKTYEFKYQEQGFNHNKWGFTWISCN